MTGLGYEIQESARARNARITIHPDGRVVVTKPARVSEREMEKFIAARRPWIEEMVEKFRKRRAREEKQRGGLPLIEFPRLRRGTKAYKEAVEWARILARERLTYFNRIYAFKYGTISIRNQKSRWGSCSQDNNLSFNYRIAFLPSELADYIIVHELCHTKEHNHSDRFWAQVSRTIPDHAKLRKQLRIRYTF